jgi:hypothetical protein
LPPFVLNHAFGKRLRGLRSTGYHADDAHFLPSDLHGKRLGKGDRTSPLTRYTAGATSTGGRTIPIYSVTKVVRCLHLNLSISDAGTFDNVSVGIEGECADFSLNHV